MDKRMVLTDVPEPDVKQIRADFESDGAKTTLVRQPNGLWTVLAEFDTPDQDQSAAAGSN